MKNELWETLVCRRIEEISPEIVESPEYEEAISNFNGIALEIAASDPSVLLKKMHELDEAHDSFIAIAEKEYYKAGIRDGFQLAMGLLAGKNVPFPGKARGIGNV